MSIRSPTRPERTPPHLWAWLAPAAALRAPAPRGANFRSRTTASASRRSSPAADATSASPLALPKAKEMPGTSSMRSSASVMAASARLGANGTCRTTATRSTQRWAAVPATNARALTLRPLRHRARLPFGSALPATAARTRISAATGAQTKYIRSVAKFRLRAITPRTGIAQTCTLRRRLRGHRRQPRLHRLHLHHHLGSTLSSPSRSGRTTYRRRRHRRRLLHLHHRLLGTHPVRRPPCRRTTVCP